MKNVLREHTSSRGFTLIEMIVSVALFSVVMVIVAAAYLNLINLDHESRSTDDVANNLSFAIDSMARAIRTGTSYECNASSVNPNCAISPGTSFEFTDSSGNYDTYILNTSTGQIGECTSSVATQICTTSIATYLTDPRVQIKNLSFYVRGALKNDQAQPEVIFTITGNISADPRSVPVTFSIETSATERTIDI